MIVVDHSDPRLRYTGRWFAAGLGRQCSWQAGQLRFRVSGVTSFNITLEVKDSTSETAIYLCSNIDGADVAAAAVTSTTEIFTGTRTQQVNLPDIGEHTVVIKLSAGLPTQQWDNSCYARLVSISLADTGALTEWVPGVWVVGLVGDSWMSAWHDWPLFLPSSYQLHPLSYGGATAAELNTRIDYVRSGVAYAGMDPVCDVVIINSSVNDYLGGVSLAAFNASFAALVTKVRAQQPTAKILLIQSPDNTAAGKTYSQYGPEMAAVAASASAITYLPTSTAPVLSWLGDGSHLDYPSRQAFAAWVAETLPALIATGKLQVTDGVTVKYYDDYVLGTDGLVLSDARGRYRLDFSAFEVL